MSRTKEALIKVAKDRLDLEVTDEMIASGKKFKDFGIDSLDTIEMLVSIEDELDLELDDSKLDEIENIQQLVEYLKEFD
jgi:acyl carrier protein|tara:strand:- start:1780 stop:2016 length:237 start_codon:yes stop_codon:yes gene_type:complete